MHEAKSMSFFEHNAYLSSGEPVIVDIKRSEKGWTYSVFIFVHETIKCILV